MLNTFTATKRWTMNMDEYTHFHGYYGSYYGSSAGESSMLPIEKKRSRNFLGSFALSLLFVLAAGPDFEPGIF